MTVLTSEKVSEYHFEDLEIYVYTETRINSNMYAIFSGNNGLIIDPVANEEVLYMMHDYQVQPVKILLTHEHYDHISGVNYYSNQFHCEVICSQLCAEALSDPKKNLSRYYSLVLQAHIGNALPAGEGHVKSYSCNADTIYMHEYETILGNYFVKAITVGGHSAGSSILFLDDKIIFTGDNLIPEENTIVTLPGGSEEDYIKVVKPLISSLNPNVMVFPGHGVPMVLKDIIKDHPDYMINLKFAKSR